MTMELKKKIENLIDQDEKLLKYLDQEKLDLLHYLSNNTVWKFEEIKFPFEKSIIELNDILNKYKYIINNDLNDCNNKDEIVKLMMPIIKNVENGIDFIRTIKSVLADKCL